MGRCCIPGLLTHACSLHGRGGACYFSAVAFAFISRLPGGRTRPGRHGGAGAYARHRLFAAAGRAPQRAKKAPQRRRRAGRGGGGMATARHLERAGEPCLARYHACHHTRYAAAAPPHPLPVPFTVKRAEEPAATLSFSRFFRDARSMRKTGVTRPRALARSAPQPALSFRLWFLLSRGRT